MGVNLKYRKRKYNKEFWKNFENLKYILLPICKDLERFPSYKELNKLGYGSMCKYGFPLHGGAKEIAKRAAEATKVGDPFAEDTGIGPVVSEVQFDKIQGLIDKGIEEGAELVSGGPGKPEGLNAGYFVRPTVFANVNNDMTIAREEIFGPVLSILPYKDEEEAIEIANDTEYGLYGYVSSGDLEHAKQVANRIRAGSIAINNAGADFTTPFGGYKQSGNGKEWGLFGFEEFLEVKAVVGFTS